MTWEIRGFPCHVSTWMEDLRYAFEVRARIGTGDTGRYRAVRLVPCHALWMPLLFSGM